MRVLSKTRFKLALECPNKLYYTGKKEYANKKQEDTFLESLAQGGFQVEELARLHYPGGILLEERLDYEQLWKRTKGLLENEEVVIYEAAFLYENLFVRTDILVKKGNHIKLIEVKAKSYDPDDPNEFTGKRGGLTRDWKDYLFDLAYQSYVIQQCLPNVEISNYFMLADKSKTAKVDGLNGMFMISKDAHNRTGIIKKVESLDEIIASVLSEVNMDAEVSGIHSGDILYSAGSKPFNELVETYSKWYVDDVYPNVPLSFSSCKNCEFFSDAETSKSGYHECFRKQKHFSDEDFRKPNIFEVWDFRKGAKLFDDGKFFLTDISESEIDVEAEAGSISRTERQWIQVQKSKDGDVTPFVDRYGLSDEMKNWKYPLHMIDFETSSVALPFTKGMRPYEQVAFQFSHHIMYEDGKVEHASEYLNADPGVFPNFDFLRALKKCLSGDVGSVFRYATHENSILNAIYAQLKSSNEPDKSELMESIKSITTSTKDSAKTWKGERNMIDLRDVVVRYYYNPLTKGSNSLKAVLPAILSSSEVLKEKYSKSIRKLELSSKNFSDEHVWIQNREEGLIDPYKILPPVFDDIESDKLDSFISEIDSLSDGGAAMMAYARLQYIEMGGEERQAIKTSMLKYCELDTLAMVMLVEELISQLNN